MYLERFSLKDRVAVVTGGAQGIGLCCVEALAEAGAHVYIADLNAETLGLSREAMARKGYDCDILQMDVTNPVRRSTTSPPGLSPSGAASTFSSAAQASCVPSDRRRPSPTRIGSTSSTSI